MREAILTTFTAAEVERAGPGSCGVAAEVARRRGVAGGAACHCAAPIRSGRHAAAVPRLRATPRGRLALIVLLLAVAGALAIGATRAPSAEAGPSSAVRTVTVRAGDSLWAIARRTAPASDPRAVVAELQTLNDLPSGMVQAGERIRVPVAVGSASGRP